MRTVLSAISSTLLTLCVPTVLVAQGAPAPGSPAGLPSDTMRPYYQLVRTALEQYHPQVLVDGVPGDVAYVYFLSDGAGRIVRTALASRPPHGRFLRDAFLERWPDVDTEVLADVPNAMFPNATNSWHRKGELGPDSLVVFWAEPAAEFGREPEAEGPYRLGRAVARQTTPRAIQLAALRAAPGEVVWYLYDDEHPLIETGTHPGGKDAVEAIRSTLAPRFPEAVLTCSIGTAAFNALGQPVRVFSVRKEARKPR